MKNIISDEYKVIYGQAKGDLFQQKHTKTTLLPLFDLDTGQDETIQKFDFAPCDQTTALPVIDTFVARLSARPINFAGASRSATSIGQDHKLRPGKQK